MSNDIKEKFETLWNGDVPLVKTYWLYYFTGVFILRIITALISPALAMVALLWAGFMIVPIWRSADKYSGNRLFALLAKISAVLIAFSILTTLL